MRTTNNTILITGGGSGIGFEMAKLFAANNNQVIITGRNADKLSKAAKEIKNVTTFVADVTNEEEVEDLVGKLNRDFPNLNIVINNAGLAHYYTLTDENADAFKNASEETLTNYLSIVRLTQKLLPLLKKQEEAAFINISSIAAFAPGILLPSYSISKAALHAYSKVLRITLEQSTAVKVFEIMPPLVATDFSKELGTNDAISPSVVAQDVLEALSNNEYEKHVGKTADMYKIYLSSPDNALRILNNKA